MWSNRSYKLHHACHMSCVTSRVMCHMSRVTCHNFFFYWTKWWSLSVEGLLSTGPTRLVFFITWFFCTKPVWIEHRENCKALPWEHLIGCKMCKIALSKSTEKVKKGCMIFLWSGCVIFLTTVTTTVTAVTTVIFFVLSQYFWKDQFDTFDYQCDILRAVFCDSRNVFSWRGWLIF